MAMLSWERVIEPVELLIDLLDFDEGRIWLSFLLNKPIFFFTAILTDSILWFPKIISWSF